MNNLPTATEIAEIVKTINPSWTYHSHTIVPKGSGCVLVVQLEGVIDQADIEVKLSYE